MAMSVLKRAIPEDTILYPPLRATGHFEMAKMGQGLAGGETDHLVVDRAPEQHGEAIDRTFWLGEMAVEGVELTPMPLFEGI